jgi:hypothetical protein
MSLWIGFGGPKPSPKQLPVSTDSCPQTHLLNRNTSSAMLMSGLIKNVTAAENHIGVRRWDHCKIHHISF